MGDVNPLVNPERWFMNFLKLKAPLTRVLLQHWATATGIVVAIFAFWATQQYAQEQVSAEREKWLPEGGLVEILVAARDLQSGETISVQSLALREIPRQWAFADSLTAADFDAVDQAVLNTTLKSGAPITQAHLRKAVVKTQLLDLPPGFRAISLSVDEVSSVGGLIQPGDRVDLWMPVTASPVIESSSAIVMLPTESAALLKPAKMIAENLRVLATGQRTEKPALQAGDPVHFSYGSLTLAVPEAIAATVLGGQLNGRLSVALRGLPPVVRPAALPNPAPQQPTPVEILVGGIQG
jgi:pilus assembly protein CpaB